MAIKTNYRNGSSGNSSPSIYGVVIWVDYQHEPIIIREMEMY